MHPSRTSDLAYLAAACHASAFVWEADKSVSLSVSVAVSVSRKQHLT